MKYCSNLFYVALLASMLVSGCKKDTDDPKADGLFTVELDNYTLGGGVLYNLGTNDWYNGSNFDLYLYSTGISVDIYDNWSGSGTVVYFETFSSSSEDLANGTYIYDAVSDPSPVFTFDYAQYCTNWTKSGPNEWVLLADGTLTALKSGGSYSLSISGEDEGGNTITGSFTGPLRKFDFIEKSAIDRKEKR